jgi:putative PIN family toxin of toxin-antitoxin system
MRKIILDTNVLVSSLIQKSYPFLIVNALLSGSKNEICISDKLMHEYYEVLNRPKFSKYPDFILKAEVLLVNIERKATIYSPVVSLNIINDFADNRLLELADESNADFLITGNTNDFTMKSYKKTEIIGPKAYFENYNSY